MDLTIGDFIVVWLCLMGSVIIGLFIREILYHRLKKEMEKKQ